MPDDSIMTPGASSRLGGLSRISFSTVALVFLSGTTFGGLAAWAVLSAGAAHPHGAAARLGQASAAPDTAAHPPFTHERVQQLLATLAHGLHLNDSQLLSFNRERVRLRLSGAHGAPPLGAAAPRNGRGILIVAGGRDMMANALITVRVLREQLNCTLPVEVVHYGDEERHAQAAQLLSEYRHGAAPPVRLVDGLATQQPGHHRRVEIKSFPAKVYAVCFVTSFKEVLMLDADSMPLVDPDVMFGWRDFQEAGVLAWPDFWFNAWVDDTIYKMFGMRVPWEGPGQERHKLADSGQMLWDRERHADVLEWLWYLNSHTEVVYKLVLGDKDTYKLAFHLAGKLDQWRQVPHFARDAMRRVPRHKHGFHHLGMIQAAPDERGSPALFHRTSFNSKFFPDCLGKDAGYCEVEYISTPLTSEQAGHSLKPNMYAFDADQIDTAAFAAACPAAASGAPSRVPDADPACSDALGVGTDVMPIPVIPVDRFLDVPPVLAASYRIFAEVRAELGA